MRMRAYVIRVGSSAGGGGACWRLCVRVVYVCARVVCERACERYHLPLRILVSLQSMCCWSSFSPRV